MSGNMREKIERIIRIVLNPLKLHKTYRLIRSLSSGMERADLSDFADEQERKPLPYGC